ncbi:hypothetical protein A3Q56_02409, partial [Intoshia linei]
MTNKRKRSSILKSSSIYQPFSGKLAKQVSFAETCHVLYALKLFIGIFHIIVLFPNFSWEFQKIGKAENSPASSINMSNVTQNDKMNDDKDTMQNISYADDCDTQNEMSISMINSDSNTSLAKNVESNNTISFTMNELTCEPNESDLCPKLSGEESNRSISILDSIYINRSDDCKELSMDCNVSLNDNDLVNVTEKIKSAKKSFSVDENNSIDMSSSNDIPMMQLNFHDVTNIGNNNDVSMNCNETNDFNNLTMIASDTIEIETNSFNMDDNKSIEIGCSNNVSMKHSYSQNISNCNKTNAEISMVSMGKNETMQISPEINHKSSKECTIQQCNTFNDISMDVAASDRSCFIKNENFDMKLSLINNDSGTCRATTNVSMNCNETNSFNMDDKSIQISCFNNMSMKDSYSQNISNCNKTNAEISMVSMGENETMQILPAINHKSSKECTVQKSNMYNDMSMDVSTSDKSCFIKDESVDMKLSLRNNNSGTCHSMIDVSMNCNETNDLNNLTMIASDKIEIETNSFNVDDKSIKISCSNDISIKHSYSQNISNCSKTNAEISMVSMGKNETVQISPAIKHKSSKECTVQQSNIVTDISMDVSTGDRSCFIQDESVDMKLSLRNNDSGTIHATNDNERSISNFYRSIKFPSDKGLLLTLYEPGYAEISIVSMGKNKTVQISPAINHKSSKECTVQKSNMYNDMSMDVSTSDKSCFIKDESVDMKLSLRNNDSGTCRATIDTAKYDNFINDTIVLKKLKKTDDCSNIFNESYVRNDASIMNVSNIDKTRIFKETFLKPIESINETKINTFVNENAEISHKVENESELDITNLDLPTLHELMTPKCSRIKTRFLLNSYTNQDNISDGYCFENIKFDEPDITDELILEAENRIKYKFDAISNIRSYDVEQFFSTKYLDTDVISIPEVLFIPEHSHLMESLPNFYEFEDDYIDNYEKKCLENYNEIIQIVENEMIKHEQIYNKRIQIEQDIKLDEEHLMQAIEKVEKLKLNGENLLRDIYAARENVFNIE